MQHLDLDRSQCLLFPVFLWQRPPEGPPHPLHHRLEGSAVLQNLGRQIHSKSTQSRLEWVNYMDLLGYAGEYRPDLLASKSKWEEVGG